MSTPIKLNISYEEIAVIVKLTESTGLEPVTVVGAFSIFRINLRDSEAN